MLFSARLAQLVTGIRRKLSLPPFRFRRNLAQSISLLDTLIPMTYVIRLGHVRIGGPLGRYSGVRCSGFGEYSEFPLPWSDPVACLAKGLEVLALVPEYETSHARNTSIDDIRHHHGSFTCLAIG